MSDAIPDGPLTLDSSVLIAMMDGSDAGAGLVNALLTGDVTAYTSFVNLAEAEYVLCRKLGHDVAARCVNDLLDSGYVTIEDSPGIHRAASAIKCQRSISLADCYCLAVAEVTSTRPVFMFREQELVKEMAKTPLPAEPVFIG